MLILPPRSFALHPGLRALVSQDGPSARRYPCDLPSRSLAAADSLPDPSAFASPASGCFCFRAHDPAGRAEAKGMSQPVKVFRRISNFDRLCANFRILALILCKVFTFTGYIPVLQLRAAPPGGLRTSASGWAPPFCFMILRKRFRYPEPDTWQRNRL